MRHATEVFADPARAALMRRGYCLWALLRNDPRFSFYGRAVGLNGPHENTADTLEWLARLQGATFCYYFPKSDVDALYAELAARGLSTDRHEHFCGAEGAIKAGRGIIAEQTLPADLTLQEIDSATPVDRLQSLAKLWGACGVMALPGPVLHGEARPGICAVLVDGSGEVAAAAASFAFHHPESARPHDVFWGMLATREDRRGEGLARYLGAHVLLGAHERFGALGFNTGVRADNAASIALCNRLGVYDTPWTYAQAIDNEVLGVSSITK